MCARRRDTSGGVFVSVPVEERRVATSNSLSALKHETVLETVAHRLRAAGMGSLLAPLANSVLLTVVVILLGATQGGGRDPKALPGIFLYVLALHLFLYLYLVYFHLPTVRNKGHLLSIHLTMTLVIVLAGLIRLDGNFTFFVVPFGFGAILLTLLFRADLAIAGSVAIAALLAPLYGFTSASGPIVLALAGQFLGIFAVRSTRKRIQVFSAGFALAGLNIALAIPYSLMDVSMAPGRLGMEILYGVAAGILASILAVGLLPVFESLLDITTVFKIQELADLDHPLLRNLFLRAPGTYQHSMAVSNLAVTAAEAIDADWLLCRVGAYFHDIGKAETPDYFAENEGYGGRSRHEDLKPSLSASVIRSHVSQGLKIAREQGLPSAVCDFIPQHHGTSVIRFFYGKALKSQQVGPEYKGEFRHTGPKPQTRETAIVMLADTVEAVSRTLEKPSPSSVEETVREIVRERLLDGELDESNLTLRDLDAIAASFIKVLNGIFHARPDYPKSEEVQAAEKEAAPANRSGEGEPREGKEKVRARKRKSRKAATG